MAVAAAAVALPVLSVPWPINDTPPGHSQQKASTASTLNSSRRTPSSLCSHSSVVAFLPPTFLAAEVTGCERHDRVMGTPPSPPCASGSRANFRPRIRSSGVNEDLHDPLEEGDGKTLKPTQQVIGVSRRQAPGSSRRRVCRKFSPSPRFLLLQEVLDGRLAAASSAVVATAGPVSNHAGAQ